MLWTVALAAQEDLTEADRMFALRDETAKLNQAIDVCQRTVQQQPDNYEAWWRLAKFEFYLSDLQKADSDKEKLLKAGIEAAMKAVDLNSKRVEGHFWLASNDGEYAELKGAFKSMSLIHSIRAEFETAYEIDPMYENGSVYQALGELYIRLPGLFGGDDDKGLELLETGVKKAPSNLNLKMTLAEFYLKKGNKDDARKLLNEIPSVNDPILTENETRDLRWRASQDLAEVK
jgi:tetratricopeptide (TPR) repeat protein